MTKKLCYFLLFFSVLSAMAQRTSKEFRAKTFKVKNDTIQIDTLSINSQKFKVFTVDKTEIPVTNYQVDFSKAQLIINKEKYTEIYVEYYRYPDFITRVYSPFDKRLIVPDTKSTEKLYSLTTNKDKPKVRLFDGLKTSGFIVRGLTTGNNQNAVTNSSLDLTIEGKLSEKVSIRGNIFDTNIPLQENGYSQNVTDFDRIFVEIFSDSWKVKGGDVSLNNKETYFLNFEKQVAGLEVSANLGKKANVLASGAIVRGRFTSNNFVGIEGNQGPYKLVGPNNEPVIVIVSGSDKVFVNGNQLERGEHKDYVIDYNLAEIKFNTTYPITNDMRIRVEFQYSDRNYTRFITYEKAQYTSDTFSISGYFYNENDAKSQPVQQSLSNDQKQILANAGNDVSQMVAPSAFLDSYSANRIQYKKTTVGVNEFFEYSTNENDELYSVTFTNVGANQGDYTVDKTIATGTIFKYVGTNLGNYSPVVRLVAPTSLQVIDVQASYQPSKKTAINAEVAFSNNDKNLFSSINDEKNKRIATKINWRQVLLDKRWQLASDVNYKYIQDEFTTVQRFQSVEFNRNWNLVNPLGNQNELQTIFTLKNKKDDFISYGYNQLRFSENFKGTKHQIQSKLNFNTTKLWFLSSLLNNNSSLERGSFFRLTSKVEQSLGKPWLGVIASLETNQQKLKATNMFTTTSHQFKEYESYFGVGDSAKIHAVLGFNYRTNDSIRNNIFTNINNRKTVYIRSQLLQNERTNLSVYANYRFTQNQFKENEKSLNSRVVYNQRLFSNFIQLATEYETSSGNIARQDYVYIKTEPGQGYFTWIDYNNDGIQDFNEFEVAQFQDQADYLRVPLPNLRYLPTHKAKIKQSVTLNAAQWNAKKGVRKFLSHFYNQSYLLVENEQERVGNTFNFNPFNFDENKLLGVNLNFRNSFYFNRNLQSYSWIYTFGKTHNKQQYVIGNQETNSFVHQLEFIHKLSKFWLLEIKGSSSENSVTTENFATRNFDLQSKEFNPNLTFLYSKDHRLTMQYQFKKKENSIGNFETLKQQQFGLSYLYISKKRNQISADVSMFLNDFEGNANSPVGYQMLEGLQVGKNYTWSTVLNQRLNSFLNVSLQYMGRKSETSKAIHTGSVQLKAIF